MELIKKEIEKALVELKISPKDLTIKLESPENPQFGDYSTNIVLANSVKLKKQLGIKDPLLIATKIREKLQENKDLQKIISRIEVVKPGFINFYLSSDHLLGEVKKILESGNNYGSSDQLKGKTLMVEFAHPNTHKMFHIGHLRNVTTGEAIVRILEKNGAKVVRANYEGDVGMHIAKCLYGITLEFKSPDPVRELENRFKTTRERVDFLGKAYALGHKAFEDDQNARGEIEKLNKKIYEQDPQIHNLWKTTRQWSLDYFETIYKRVGTHFDRYYFESEVFREGREIVLHYLKEGIFEKSEGAVIFPGEKFSLHNRVFVTKEGNATYEAKDMALAKLQFKEYSPDLILHVVGPEQAGYFQVIFKALAQVFPETENREKHLIYGWVKLKHGKMSSREGNVILGEWLLNEAKMRVKKIMESLTVKPDTKNETIEEIAEKVAVGAVKHSFLKVGLSSQIAFDFEESVNFDGDSGPYLQYVYARTQSIREKNPGKQDYDFQAGELKLEPEEEAVLRSLKSFPEIVQQAGQKYAPGLICSYLFDLSQKYNLFYHRLPILKAEEGNLQKFRLALNEAVGQVVKNGLYLLGIETVEKM